MTGAVRHYDEKYFAWQRTVGEFGGKANLFKFEEHIRKTDDVLDFGSGGGYLLKNIDTQGKKLGVEINAAARENAKRNGISCVDDITKVQDNSVDVLISNHALEHVDNPTFYINEFKRITKHGGKIVLCVPHEVGSKIKTNDINMHLYTWSPQNLYNLLSVNGLNVIECKRLTHAWMPHYIEIQRLFGWGIFNQLCRLYARITRRYQVLIIAIK